MAVNLDCVGHQHIDLGGRDFSLVNEAEPVDTEHGALTPVDVYQVINWPLYCTAPVDRMSHRKRRETKQQPSRARSGNPISCCLVSLHFLCDILSTGPVHSS